MRGRLLAGALLIALVIAGALTLRDSGSPTAGRPVGLSSAECNPQAKPETGEQPASATEDVQGRVILHGATDHSCVRVSASGWTHSTGAYADRQGYFTLSDVVPGYNVVDYSRDGYDTVRLGFVVQQGERLQLSDVRLFSLGEIAGRVISADGEPVEGALVFVCQSNPPGATKDITDREGRFRFRSRSPGFHQVFAYQEDTSSVGEGTEGGLGVTVLVNPGATVDAEELKLVRRHNVDPDDLLRRYGPDC